MTGSANPRRESGRSRLPPGIFTPTEGLAGATPSGKPDTCLALAQDAAAGIFAGFADVLRADRHDHEFLDVDRVVGMLAAIDDVHHRHRQDARRCAADIAIQRLAGGFGRGLGDGQRHAEDRQIRRA